MEARGFASPPRGGFAVSRGCRWDPHSCVDSVRRGNLARSLTLYGCFEPQLECSFRTDLFLEGEGPRPCRPPPGAVAAEVVWGGGDADGVGRRCVAADGLGVDYLGGEGLDGDALCGSVVAVDDDVYRVVESIQAEVERHAARPRLELEGARGRLLVSYDGPLWIGMRWASHSSWPCPPSRSRVESGHALRVWSPAAIRRSRARVLTLGSSRLMTG
jgi:hypothetical protein